MPFYAGRGEKWRVFSNNVLQDLRGLRAAMADAGDALADLAEELNNFFAQCYEDGTIQECAETYGVQAALIEQ